MSEQFQFNPAKRSALAMWSLLLCTAMAAVGVGVYKIASSAFDIRLVLWIFLPLTGMLLGLFFAYRIYQLITARYELDRNGFYLIWGMAAEYIPLKDVETLIPLADLQVEHVPHRFGWLGLHGRKQEIEGLGAVEIFTATTADDMILISYAEKKLIISPADTKGFTDSFARMNRRGVLERIQPFSFRPDFLSVRIWQDQLARWLLLAGLGMLLLLVAFLVVRGQQIMSPVPIGFDPPGNPVEFGAFTRLLLLPFAGGLVWLINLVLGIILYRDSEEQLAYVLWGCGILTGILMFGGAIQLVSNV